MTHHPEHLPHPHVPEPLEPAELLGGHPQHPADLAPMVLPVVVTEPVQVRERPTRRVAMGSFPVLAAGGPVQLLGPDPSRARTVLACSGSPALLAADRYASSTVAFTLPTGQLLELSSRLELWALPGTADATVSVLTEHVD